MTGKKRGTLNTLIMALLHFPFLRFSPKVDINLISFFEKCITDYLLTGFESSCKGQLNNYYLGLAGSSPDSENIEFGRLELLTSEVCFIFPSKVRCVLCS